MTKASELWTDPNQGLQLAQQTQVYDREHQRTVFWIRGVIVPPVGTEIELSDPDSQVGFENDVRQQAARGGTR
jgi:hypothetical protein